jgi:hypothetical protein
LRRGTVLGLSRTVLRLLVAVLWLLRLVRAWLLGLNGARVRLAGTDLRLLWLTGKNLRLGGTVVGPDLGLSLGLSGLDLGLTGSYVLLAGPGGLDLRLVVWFTWAIS